MKKFFLFLLSLATLPSFVSACGGEHSEQVLGGMNMAGFRFFGGVISALIIVAIVLSIMVLNKRIK